MPRPVRRRVAMPATAACLLAALAACGGRPPSAHVPDTGGPPTWVLTPTQLDELAVDRTWEGWLADGSAFTLYTGPDGRQRLRAVRDGGAAVLTDHGIWSLEGNAACSQWARGGDDGGGRKHCVVVAPGEDGYRAYNPDGSLHAVFRVRAGNPNGI